MERLRGPFQGTLNIIKFNWHYYLFASLGLIALWVFTSFVSWEFRFWGYVVLGLMLSVFFLSLAASLYIYDCSGLYRLSWLDGIFEPSSQKIVNITAGFDETSTLLKAKWPEVELCVFDFYEPERHTEISIKRARLLYPAYPGTQQVESGKLPVDEQSVDLVVSIFALHEIRNNEERVLFFKEATRILKNGGRIVVTEHLRDLPNFLAYNIGFFHFLSKKTWLKTLGDANLTIFQTIKVNPFITTFVIGRGNSAQN